MRVVPFKPAHLAQIDFGEYERETFAQTGMREFFPAWPTEGAFSIIDGEKVLCSGGVFPQGRRGICWSVMSDELRKHPVFLVRTFRRYIEAASHDLDVIILAIPEDYPSADRWAQALGFEFNCIRPSDGIDPRPHMEYVKWPQAPSL